jgi:hypothetical protein
MKKISGKSMYYGILKTNHGKLGDLVHSALIGIIKIKNGMTKKVKQE